MNFENFQKVSMTRLISIVSKPMKIVLFCCYFLVEEKFVLKKKVQKMFGQTKMGSKEILGPRVQKILGKKIFWAKEVLS